LSASTTRRALPKTITKKGAGGAERKRKQKGEQKKKKKKLYVHFLVTRTKEKKMVKLARDVPLHVAHRNLYAKFLDGAFCTLRECASSASPHFFFVKKNNGRAESK
jgi:hypothetical protein